MQWIIDTSHSGVEFSVRHMGISTVKGKLKTIEGSLEADASGHPSRLEAKIDLNGIDTNDDQRDGHLKSPDFFHIEQYPHMTFSASKFTPKGEHVYVVDGELTIRGQTKPVQFEVEVSGPVKDPWGNQRMGATASGKINRKDFGLTWNQVLEFGALLVGEEVKFNLDAELVAKPA